MTESQLLPPIPRDAGPLVVASRNPRYFTHATGPTAGRAVHLTGSHVWNNLHDGMGPGPEAPAEPERFDYDGYLRFLAERGHNFIRLWRWEHIRSQAAGGNFHLDMSPQPWRRTGPGEAKDGRPRFDLAQLDPAYFERLRDRAVTALDAGIYVDVMLFDGWALHLSPAPDSIEGHPFHARNNVNDIAARSIDDLQVLPLDPRVEAITRAYVERVVDTLHDLPNVLWEVANESAGGGAVTREMADFLGMAEIPSWGDSTPWQGWVIDVVKRHEAGRGYSAHPIGMTMQYPVADQTKVNEPLLHSSAEWISPGFDDDLPDGQGPMTPGAPPSRWFADPPPADGTKVVISDTDHYAPGQSDPLWAWKSFLRGHHPILMDFGLIGGLEPGGPGAAESGVPPFEAYEPTRYAMGDTRRYAERVDLIAMTPQPSLASSGYALAEPGRTYLVLAPEGDGSPLDVTLEPGRYEVEWFDVLGRSTRRAERLDVRATGPVSLRSPFGASPAVAHMYADVDPA